MDPHTKDNLRGTISKAMDIINGLTANSTRVFGRTIEFMGKATSFGPMEGDTRDST